MHFLSRLNYFLLIQLFGTQPFSLLHVYANTDHDCYPASSGNRAEYLIGYGSLMQKPPKNGTHQHYGPKVPIRLFGFERSWSHKEDSVGFSTTYVGVQSSSNTSSYINAVYFRIPSAVLHNNFDKSEKFSCREEVDISKIHFFTKHGDKTCVPIGKFWIYVTKPEYRATPTAEFPIVQSDVDKFISGCLELEMHHKLDGFAEECVRTTSSWESPWVNDRIHPRRPFLFQKMSGQIDRLLNKTVHEAYKSIKIKSGM